VCVCVCVCVCVGGWVRGSTAGERETQERERHTESCFFSLFFNQRTHVHQPALARARAFFSPKRNEGIPLVTSLGGLNFYHWVAGCVCIGLF
jgi:hypothetical protein